MTARTTTLRVLFVAHGPAHVPWIVPLSWACQLAGHEVRVAARPQSVGAVTAAGLVAVPIGSATAAEQIFAAPLDPRGGPPRPAEQWLSGPLAWDDERRAGWANAIIKLADSQADDLVGFARSWRPDIVVHDTGAVAGLVAAAAVGVPAIGHCWGHSLGLHFPDDDHVPAAYRRLFERFGLPPAVGPAVWIDPCPPSLRRPYPVRRLDMRFVPYSGAGEVPPWLLEPTELPRVCLSGGVTTQTFSVLRDRLLDAVADLDAEIVLAVADRDLFAGRVLPDNVRLVGYFPLTALLPTCRTLVHHGGTGTGMLAFTAGLPQVVTAHDPMSLQSLWGDLVQEAGAGLTLRADERAEPGRVRAAISATLTDPGYARQAARIRDEIAAMPDPSHLVDFLTRCAADRGTESIEPALTSTQEGET